MHAYAVQASVLIKIAPFSHPVSFDVWRNTAFLLLGNLRIKTAASRKTFELHILSIRRSAGLISSKIHGK